MGGTWILRDSSLGCQIANKSLEITGSKPQHYPWSSITSLNICQNCRQYRRCHGTNTRQFWHFLKNIDYTLASYIFLQSIQWDLSIEHAGMALSKLQKFDWTLFKIYVVTHELPRILLFKRSYLDKYWWQTIKNIYFLIYSMRSFEWVCLWVSIITSKKKILFLLWLFLRVRLQTAVNNFASTLKDVILHFHTRECLLKTLIHERSCSTAMTTNSKNKPLFDHQLLH